MAMNMLQIFRNRHYLLLKCAVNYIDKNTNTRAFGFAGNNIFVHSKFSGNARNGRH